MFFQNFMFFIFCKFLWAGIFWGFIKIACNLVCHISRKNVYVCNLVGLAFWLGFGLHFIRLCESQFNNAFCWFGLAGMFLGSFLVKFSIDFLFTNLLLLLYNKLAKLKSGRGNKQNGKLQPNKKN